MTSNIQTSQPTTADKPSSPYRKTRYIHLRLRETNGVYYLWFKYKGKRYNPSLDTSVESVALLRADTEMTKIKKQIQSGRSAGIGKQTFNELLTQYLAHNENRIGLATEDCISRSAYGSIEDGVKKIRKDKAAWLDRDAAKFTFDEFKSYADATGKAHSPTTYNRVVDAIKNAYKLAVEKEQIAFDPTAKLKRAPLRLKSDVVLTDKQYVSLIAWLKNCDSPNKYNTLDLVEFLRYFGFRIKQAAQVLKSDVRLADDWRTNDKTIVGSILCRKEDMKRGKMDRQFPIIREAALLIEKLLDRKPNTMNGTLQRADKLLPIGRAYGLLGQAYRALNFDPRLVGHHHFRHLAATKWRECGIDFKVIGELLGHSKADGGKLAMTLYSHVRTDALENDLSKIHWGTPTQPLLPPLPENGKIVPMVKAA